MRLRPEKYRYHIRYILVTETEKIGCSVARNKLAALNLNLNDPRLNVWEPHNTVIGVLIMDCYFLAIEKSNRLYRFSVQGLISP